MTFSVSCRDPGCAARAGTLSLGHGEVETPAFMPVGTAAAVKGIDHERLAGLGYRLILANTYHLAIRPGIGSVKAMGGLHGFCGWSGNILTDSGGFQLFSLAKLRRIDEEGATFQSHLDGARHLFTPENVVEAQVAFGSDIQMALDVCTGHGVSLEEATRAAAITTRWAQRARDAWRTAVEQGYGGALFGIVQGNFHPELRARSADEIGRLGLPGIAIGGLSVGEPAGTFREMLALTAERLDPCVPHYLMGVGTPDYIFDSVTAGIDMFDCVFPTRIARNGTVLTFDGRVVLRHEAHASETAPIDPECGCRVCARYSRGYLRHLFKSGEMLGPMLATEHNLWFMAELMRRIRAAIAEGRFAPCRKEILGRFDEGERERRARRN